MKSVASTAVGNHDRARDAQLPGHEYEQRPDQHRKPDAADDPRMPAIAEIARHELVETGQRKRRDRDQRRAQEQQRRRQIARHIEGRVAQRDRQPQRHTEQKEVPANQDATLVEAWQLKQPGLPARPQWMERRNDGHLPPCALPRNNRRPLKQRQQQFLMQAQQDSRSAFVVSAICPIRKNREIALGWLRC